MSKLHQKSGFTLVEIIIVISIAGLILLIVFLALDQADKTRKDHARQNDAGRFLTAAQQWVSDNNGSLPTGAVLNNIKTTYITNSGATFATPEGVDWVLTPGVGTPGSATEMRVQAEASCNGGSSVANNPSNHTRQIAVVVLLNTGLPYCVSK